MKSRDHMANNCTNIHYGLGNPLLLLETSTQEL